MKASLITLGVFLVATAVQSEEPNLSLDALLTSGLNNQTTPRSLMESPEQVVSKCTQQLDKLADSAKRHRLLCDRAEANILLANLSAAEEDIQAVLENEPNSFHALFLKAQIHRKRNQKQAALELCNQLLVSSPKSAPLLTLRAATRLPLYGTIETGVRDQVVQDTTAALESDPTYYRAYLIRAIAYEYSRDLDSALKDVNRYLEHRLVGTPGHENLAYLIKGRIHYTRMNWREAIHYCDIALTIDPDSFPAAQTLWFSLRSLTDSTNAFKAAQIMQRIDPEHTYTQMAMGLELKDAGEYASAIPYLKKWASDSVEGGRPFENLAFSYSKNKQYHKAMIAYEEAVARTPDSASLRLSRATFLTYCPEVTLRRVSFASHEVEQILKSKAKLSLQEMVLAALVQHESGDSKDAIQTLQELRKRPDFALYDRKLQVDKLIRDLKEGKKIPAPVFGSGFGFSPAQLIRMK